MGNARTLALLVLATVSCTAPSTDSAEPTPEQIEDVRRLGSWSCDSDFQTLRAELPGLAHKDPPQPVEIELADATVLLFDREFIGEFQFSGGGIVRYAFGRRELEVAEARELYALLRESLQRIHGDANDVATSEPDGSAPWAVVQTTWRPGGRTVSVARIGDPNEAEWGVFWVITCRPGRPGEPATGR